MCKQKKKEELQEVIKDMKAMDFSDDDDEHPGDDGDDYGAYKHPKVIGSIEDELKLLDLDEVIFIRKVCRDIIKNTPKTAIPTPVCSVDGCTTRLIKPHFKEIGMCASCEKFANKKTF